MNKTKRIILLSALAILGILIGIYTINPNRWRTQDMLETKGKHTGKDFMLSSLNVTTIAQDNEKLIWIGTSAGINVYNGHDYIQFFHDSEDSTALPDDYINVLHRDRKGRMWIGTQNGLAKYEGGYRFHRFTLPTANGNIQEIEDAHQGAVTVSNGQEHFLIKGNEVKKMDSSKKHSDDKNSLKKIKEKKRRKIESHLKEWTNLYPDFLLSLNKPKQLISNTFKDAGGNLWIGYRNAGYQVISENVMAYKYANRNPLADATRGMDIIAMQTVGNHILAGTTLRLFVYEAKKGEPKYYYYEDNSSLNNIVPLDNDKLEKVMDNLFTNALKHTSNQGIIRITASCRDGKLQISIFNSGEPIEENRLKDVFKRYYQLSVTEGNHHYGWGTGIGLYYVKRLIGLHHGEISVRNQSSGVEFSFWIPTDKSIYTPSEQVEEKTGVMQIPLDDTYETTKEEAEEKASADSTDESSETTQKPKILVVDDDIDVAQYITSLLSNDYTVVNRYSAEEALEDLEQVKPDLILSDIIMGKMSGYDFCKTIKQNLLFSHIPVILITAKSNMNEQITGLRLGAVAYITKPFDPIYLKAMVQTQLHNMTILRKGLVDSTDTETLDAPVANTLSDQDRKFMDELYTLMEKRSAEMELNVTTMCHDLLISQSKFAYKLKELTGETPGSFFRRYKLNKAARLLQEGKYNVSEVAVMIGFNTAAHFSVAFKKQFGVTPSEFQSSSHT